ncbi:triokinase/FMN cyclase-like [Clavelina lepadiformis]|uniref:triokinase/FMN cyclase-like n=1 Tax=Clavelina lepadiformis TaxID=159417 RepID=UPI00404314B7
MSRTNRLLINDVDRCVDEMLEGIVLENPAQRILEGHRVVIREDVSSFCSSGHVSIISGGGSGHEPFAAGFVGKGMLTAAVAGSVFASPPPHDILAAIESVASPDGVLLIVANYTGDRLNFGIALERARNRGHKIDMIVVGEDCALESKDKTAGRRGLVGIVNVMKVAGALSESGKSLEEIVKITKVVSSSMGTIGVSLSGCSIPGIGSSFQLDQSEMELGLGAHGEAGVKRMKILSADDTVTVMIDHITNESNASRLNLVRGDRVFVTLNNLGGMSALEMHVLSRKTILLLESRGILVERFQSGYLMTSLDMAGFNMNIMKVDDDIISLLDADTSAPGWPRMSFSPSTGSNRRNSLVIHSLQPGTMNNPVKPSNKSGKGEMPENSVFLAGLQQACKALIANEALLNELDTSAGDGDCGSTFKRGASDVLSKLQSWKHLDIQSILMKIASSAESSMGGASGGLYSLFLTAASRHATGTDVVSCKSCLDAGMQAISRYGGAEPGDRTMLDALLAASNSLQNSVRREESLREAAVNVAKVVAEAAEATKNMKAKAGRASYVASNLLTQPDAGATAVVIWLDAINKFINSA